MGNGQSAHQDGSRHLRQPASTPNKHSCSHRPQRSDSINTWQLPSVLSCSLLRTVRGEPNTLP